MPRIRPEELSKVVSKAVELAKSKHKVDLQSNLFQPDFTHLPWWIVGRILRDKIDLNQAHQVSELITSEVNGKGDAFQAATVRVGPDILVGFIERVGNHIEVPDLLRGGGLQQL